MKKINVLKSYILTDITLIDINSLTKAFTLLLKKPITLRIVENLIEVSDIDYNDLATLNVSLNAIRIDNNLDYLTLVIVPLHNPLLLNGIEYKKSGVVYFYELLLDVYQERDLNLDNITRIFKDLPNEILLTVKNYINCNHSLTSTGEYMFAHRNTINYRVNKFISLTSIDIRDTHNSIFVGLILNLMKI